MDKTMYSCYFIVAAVALLCIGHCSIENEWQRTVIINPFNGTRNDTCYNSGGGLTPSSLITCEDINAGFQFRTSSTRFMLRPGMHYLSDPVPFKSVNQLAIFGDNGSNSTVVCETGAGFSFINSSDIMLQWVTYLGCGVLQNSTSKNFSTDGSEQSGLRLQTFLVGFYFYQCHDIVLDYITIANSCANGLVMYDTVGNVVVMNSIFYNNRVGSNHSGGGGVSVEFSFCKPGDERCDNDHFQVGNNSHSTYVFHNCTFAENEAGVAEKYRLVSGFIAPHWSIHEALGRGGGLSLYFKGTATNNTITIINCSFRHNHAVWGGGLIVEFQDNSTANFVNVTSCHFERNHCYYTVSYGSGGGAIRVSLFNYFGLSLPSHWNGNQVLIHGSTFEKNRALNGGAISIAGALQSETHNEQITRASISNCTFVNNFGRLGSALEIRLLFILSKGNVPQVDISDCVFTNNTVKYTNNVPYYNTGIGAVYVSEIPVTFLSSVHFEQNVGSALSAFDTQLNFSNCKATFKSNHGKDGGAIALLGAAYLLINDSTNMTFINNTAEQRGGAIYNMYVSKNSMKTSTGCFLRYETPFITKWKSHFVFIHNNAGHGKSIFSTSILPCAWNFGSGIDQDTKHIFCWDEEHWNYSGQNCTDEIYTEANSFPYIGDPVLVLPGQQFLLPITAYDDMSHDITKQVVYRASIQNRSIARVDPKFAYVANNEMTITGLNQSENHSIVLMLDTIGSPVWHIDVNVQIQPCPPGLTRDTTVNETWNNKCVCSTYGGQLQCTIDDDSYEVAVRNGYWIGNVSDVVLMGECYDCRTDNESNFYPLRNIRSLAELDSYICGVNNRTGVLCGECIENYGPAVNTWNFNCIACNNSDVAKNTIKYFFTTYIPLFFLFLAIIVFKVQLTTGPANAFVLYAQLISSATFDVSTGGAIASNSALNPHTTRWLLDAYYFVYGIFNLEFISYAIDPYCLTPNFNTLDILQTQYCVAVFPLLMIIAVVLFLKLKESCLGRCFRRCFSRCAQRFLNQTTNPQEGKVRKRSGWKLADNLLHAFVAFTLLSYTKFTTSATFILGTTALFGEDGTPVGSRRLYVAGQYQINQTEYFYTYGLLAGIILATFVALPPLLLLGPLQWFNQLVVPRVSCLRRYWPSIKVNIVLDAFQGCYKPHTRFFAGLYFLFRVAVLANYVATSSFFHQYIIQQILVTIMIALLAIFQPYRRQLFNYVDTLIFVNMAIMNSLNIFIAMSSELNPQASFPMAVFIILYILVYLPLVYIIGYILYYFKLHYKERVTRQLKLWYKKCCCRRDSLSSRPLLDAASGNIQRSDYGSLIDDASLLLRAEEANTFQASPSIRRAVGLDNNTTNATSTKKDENSNSDAKCLHSSDQDSGLRSRTMNTTPASTQSMGDDSPNGDE